ncbi:MAG: hypothetical protein V2A34_06765 [Lentisphaerota bacterium]
MSMDSLGATNATQQSILEVSEAMKKAVTGTIDQAAKMIPAAAQQSIQRAASENAAQAVECMINLVA